MSQARRMKWGRTNLPLEWRMGLLVFAGVLILFGLLAGLGSFLADERARQRAAERLTLARQAARSFDRKFEEQFERLERAAARGATLLDDPDVQEPALRRLLRDPEPFVRNVFMTDEAGRLRWASRPDLGEEGAELGGHPYVREPLATGARYASGVHAAESDGRPTIVFTVPIRDLEGQPVGVLGASNDPSHATFQVLVGAARQLGETGHAELVDQDARSIVSSEPDRVLQLGRHPDFYRSFLTRHASGVALPEAVGAEAPPDDDEQQMVAFVSLQSVPWGVAVGTSDGDSDGDSDATFGSLGHRWQGLLAPFGAPALATTLVLVWVTRRSVVGPVLALTQTSRRIADGDLATPVPHLGGGEVRVLAEALDNMRLRLRDALETAAVEQSRYQGIIEAMTDAVFTTDSQQRVTAFNPAAEALTGWRATEVMGKGCYETVMQGMEGTNGAAGPADRRETCINVCPLLAASPAPAPPITKESFRRRDGRLAVVATA
ncbi:MAG: HAMP domain-containing protein, partial [Chloroflexota bacterium]